MSDPIDKTGHWPTLETAVIERDTLVGAPPPPGAAPPPPDAPPPPPDRRIGLGMLLGLLVLLLVAGGVLLAWYLSNRNSGSNVTTVVTTVASTTAPASAAPAKVTVPRVIGLKEQQALVQLASAGLHPKEVYRQTAKPTGTVVSQQPDEATEARKGSVVRIVVDGGAPKVTMPPLIGSSATAAQAKLDSLGLTATQTSVTSPKPAGTVVDQAPKPGAGLSRGSNVTLSVATGPGTAGQTTTAPTTTTTASATTTAASTTTPTTTAAAAPPQPQNATVPDVGGQTEAEAAQALWKAGVTPSFVFVPGDQPLGTVVGQAKPSGTTIPYHGHMQVNLSQGPHASTMETVPNVVGRTLQDAVSGLNAAGLRLIFVKQPVPSRAQVGKIVRETPGAGAQAPQNAQILVFLGVLGTS